MMFCLGSKTTVRPARIHDCDAVLALGERYRQESFIYYPPIDRDRAWEVFRTIIENPDQFCAFVAVVEGKIFGWVQGYISVVMLYTDERSANLDLLYVLPEHRTGWGRKLFNEFLRWGRANASRIVVGTGTGIDRAEVLFRRAGFKSTGKQYMMEV